MRIRTKAASIMENAVDADDIQSCRTLLVNYMRFTCFIYRSSTSRY
jgi:hypothetical protein